MPPVRVLVVDDSVVVRRLVSRILDEVPWIEVVGTAADGHIALDRVDQLAPDLVTMDVEMPGMNGIACVRALRRRGCRMPVVMLSTLTERGAEATLAALAAGATHYVTKPTTMASAALAVESLRDQLVPVVRALVPRPETAPTPTPHRPPVPSRSPSLFPPPGPRPALGPAAAPGTALPPGRPAVPGVPQRRQTVPVLRPSASDAASGGAFGGAWGGVPGRRRGPEVLAVGSSTGGPEALARLLGSLPASLPVPVVITQHMPATFTRQLAARLDRTGPLRVAEAADGEFLVPGTVLVAPGDFHLSLRRSGGAVTCALGQGPPENFCRPAVDVMLRSAVDVFGAGVLAVVLTGMGSDGRAGCAEVRRAGGRVLVQDQATSVVWGMPGAVASAGLADAVLPLPELAPAVAGLLAGAAALSGAR